MKTRIENSMKANANPRPELNNTRLTVLAERHDKLTEEWDELIENKGGNEYVKYREYEDGSDNGYLTVKSIKKPMRMKEVLSGMQLFKGEFEGKVETGYRRKDGTPVKDIANATRKLRSPQEQLEEGRGKKSSS